MKKRIVVIYHKADFDGLFCREIAKKFLPGAILIGWDYGDPVPGPDVVGADDFLYMLDISADGLMDHPRLVWIDHHQTAIEKYGWREGFQVNGVAACRLAWQWFGERWPLSMASRQVFVDRTVREPLAVRLVGEYDVFDKRDPDAELFQHGLRSEEIYSATWDSLLDMNGGATVPRLLNQGRALQFAKAQENESIIKSAGFTVQFEGLTFLACNHARYNSFLFTAGLKPEHDACLGFAWRDNKWTVSLYHAPGKEHHDLSLIAVKHGGGGHRGACGFQTKTLSFLPAR